MHFARLVSLTLLLLIVSAEAGEISYDSLSDGFGVSIHILTVDPRENTIIPVKASGRETVQTLANRYGAFAAINGGFWKQDGSPAGILKIDHQWYGIPQKPRGAIGWSNSPHKVVIDRVLTEQLNNEHIYEVIPASTTSFEWQDLEHIVGGTPVLISNGHLVEDYSPEQVLDSFLTNRHPRTAVGIKATGEWVFIVVDGRYLGFLGGVTIRKLAEFMLFLGCVQALNLDGGGSSTLVYDGVVINIPCGNLYESGKHVSAVSDAILILP